MVEPTTSAQEVAFSFGCHGDELVGVLHEGDKNACVGVLFVVGGRQYRVGAHRQFVKLARYLASRGVPVLRFDVRGMGDSAGAVRHFLSLDDDIKQAMSAFKHHLPNLTSVALWGLCDGASAAVLHTKTQRGIVGLMLVNPWISTQSGVARTYLKHYYLKRFADLDFWRQAMSGRVDLRASLYALVQTFNQLFSTTTRNDNPDVALPDIAFDALRHFGASVNIIISENDMTAREFEDEYHRRIETGQLSRESSHTITRIQADHTFSSAEAHQQLCQLTLDWVSKLK